MIELEYFVPKEAMDLDYHLRGDSPDWGEEDRVKKDKSWE